MMQKIEWKWEEVSFENEGRMQSYRAKVYGGWVLETIVQDLKHKLFSTSSVFIPDRDHVWQIIKPVEETEQKSKANAKDFETK